MAVVEITSIPPLVSSNSVQYFSFGFVGPWQVGTNLYCVLGSLSGSDITLHVFKSTDGGTTWTAQDDSNVEAFNVGGQQSVFEADTITLFFTNVPPGDSDALPFDIASDLYQTIVTATEPAGSPSEAFAALRSDGSIIYVFRADGEVAARIFNGTLGTRFTVDSEVTANIDNRSMVVDASDTTHVITVDVIGDETRYVTVDASDTASAHVVIPNIVNFAIGRPLAFDGDKLAFPYADATSGFFRIKLLYATGATTNPASASWSQIDVWTSGLDADSNDQDPFAILDTNGDLLVFWINSTSSGIYRMYYARFNGATFAVPVLFYDASLYPPAGATQDPILQANSLAIVDGLFTGITGMDIDGTGYQTFYLTNGGTPPVGDGYFHSMY